MSELSEFLTKEFINSDSNINGYFEELIENETKALKKLKKMIKRTKKNKEVTKMEIDYEKAFKKLVEQVKIEKGWAEEDMSDEIKWQGKPDRYTRGMVFAYRSVFELAEKLENGTFDFNE